ncbi:MAG: hypothetical protein WD097_06860 [Balneolales bacterium]
MEEKHDRAAEINDPKGRKQALTKEMQQIQSEIESSLNEVRTRFSDRISLRYWAGKYPLHLIGSALITGYILARKTGRSYVKTDKGDRISGLLMKEIKIFVARRAIKILLEQIEQAIENRKKE